VCVIPAQKLYDLQKQSSTFELKEVFYQGVTKRTNKREAKQKKKKIKMRIRTLERNCQLGCHPLLL